MTGVLALLLVNKKVKLAIVFGELLYYEYIYVKAHWFTVMLQNQSSFFEIKLTPF